MEIQKEDRAALALMCGILDAEVPEKVPEEVLFQYGRARRIMSRVGAGGPLPPAAMVIVGLCGGLGYELPGDQKPPTFEEHIRNGRVKPGDHCLVEWQGRDKEATFIKLTTGRRISALLEGKKDPITVELGKAKLLETATVGA